MDSRKQITLTSDVGAFPNLRRAEERVFMDVYDLKPLRTSNKIDYQLRPSSEPDARARALRILLLEPFYPPDAAWGSAKTEQGYLPPMGVISVYAWLRHRGYAVEFLDTQFGDVTAESLRRRLVSASYDIVGMPVFTPTADYVFATAKIVRQALPKAKIVLGGIHATALPELTLEQCPESDFVVRHEGEYTFEALLDALVSGTDFASVEGLAYRDPGSGRVIVNRQRPFLGDLDSLPHGFYSDLDLTRYVPHPTQYVRLPSYPVMTQRGCPYFCSYCEASTILGKKTRFFSPQRVVEELKILKKEKGARGIYFQDSTFTIKRTWTLELMNLMVRENLDLRWSCNTRADRVDPELLDAMYRAGGRQIVFGIESGNQQSLDTVRKGCTVEEQTRGVEWTRAAGFRYVTSFIICLPGETPDMVKTTIEYAKSLRGHIAMFYLPVPYPGSELYQTCKASGGLRRDVRWSDFISIDFDDPVYVNPNFDRDSMRYWYKRAFLDFYSSPRTWMANLSGIREMDDVRRLIRGATALGAMMFYGLGGFLKHQYRGYHGQGAPLRSDS